MSHFYYESTIQAPAKIVFNWHLEPDAIKKLTPPWEPVEVVGTPARIDENMSRTTLKISILGFIQISWVAEHRNFQPGKSFQDVQIAGPFAQWIHTHSVEPLDGETCRYIDSIEYKLPIGWLGELCGGRIVRQKLYKLFSYRHNRVKEECERLAVTKRDELNKNE